LPGEIQLLDCTVSQGTRREVTDVLLELDDLGVLVDVAIIIFIVFVKDINELAYAIGKQELHGQSRDVIPEL